MDAELTREAAKLYALPPAEFTAARNERSKALRAKDADLAAAVAKLPKLTAAAAAVNRLARDEPSEVRALVQSGRRLRKAQEAAVAGRSDAEALRVATKEHRAALERVGREARKLGLSAAVLESVTRTLRSASTDPELQPLLERGVIAREGEAGGFGLDPSLVPAKPAAPARRRRDDGAAAAKKRRDAQAAVRAARERLAEARRAAREAERELGRAEKAAAAAREELEAAEAALESARGAAAG